ncbi:MAG: hypothetical protein KatS3mg002_0269 [Candidatus Woesearchaeota archaeon]|nr:MAG: hypothetical protein KatS3mg002_0269 [Candidatus Woesearchaeota archaeon]
MRIYLAGRIGNDFEYASSWRKNVTKMCEDLDIKAISPEIGSEYFVENLDLVVTLDLALIDSVDLVLANVGPSEDTVLTGTVCEVFYATQIKRIPVIAFVLNDEKPSNQVKSPWLGQFFSPRYHVHKYSELNSVLYEWKRVLYR